ncbi:hypothetical protein NL676_039244 [Syzygium grande]|nr:hypothetical protein NL676_039244 [Syzygium grande]
MALKKSLASGKFRAYFARARNGATVVLGRTRVHFSSATAASATVATKVGSPCHIDGCGSAGENSRH